MNEISDLQQKRALNSIWSAAQDYGIRPEFKAFDAEGRAELYLNLIIGALYRHYDYQQLAPVFEAFSRYEDADTYEGLLWLGLENCVYQREVRERPVLQRLRRDYAERFMAAGGESTPDDYRLLDCLTAAHWQRVLGREPRLGRYDRKLLDELEFSPELSTEELVRRANELFAHWFQIRMEERRRERRRFQLPTRRRRTARGRYRPFGFGFLEHPLRGGRRDRTEEQLLKTSLKPEELRDFMSGKFGRSLFSPKEMQELERRLCTGNHALCHLHLTRGDPAGLKIQSGFMALQRQQEAAQQERNRRWFEAHRAAGRAGIRKLAAAIQNSVLLYLHPSPVRADTGRLEGGRVWRAARLNDGRVFTRNEQGNMGDVCVDLLLDASTSQQHRQEIVSNQGYMIAEALSRCAIPCRVMGFCSMTGYTILRIYRDYQEPGKNARIFDYVSNGCNRDGLAIRTAHELIRSAPYEHKLLIVLSDVKPHDILRIPESAEAESAAYERDAGVRDTALEVRRARADGIAVACVFTGEDEDLPAARLVYGRDFARIQSLDRLADTVSLLIRNQLRNL